jgi:hypothetical protein
MKFPKTRLVGMVAAAMVIAIAGAVEASAQAVDLSGDWIFSVTTDTGVTMPEVTLVQDGGTLSGRYSSDALGQSPISGRVTGSEMRFEFSADLQGQLAPVEYAGTVNADGTISGTMDIAGGLLVGTFTATRVEG